MAYRNWPVFLVEMRRQLGLKQSALADALGISQSTISKWEKGTVEPTLASQKNIYTFYRAQTLDRYSAAFIDSFEHWLVIGIITNTEARIIAMTNRMAAIFDLNKEDYSNRHVNDVFDHKDATFGEVVRREGFFDGKIARIEFCNGMRLAGTNDNYTPFVGHSYPHITESGFLMISIGDFITDSQKTDLWPKAHPTVRLIPHTY